MRKLLALLCPPLGVLFTFSVGDIVLSVLLYVLAWLGVFFFIVPGVVFYLLAVIHAWGAVDGRKSQIRFGRLQGEMERRMAMIYQQLGGEVVENKKPRNNVFMVLATILMSILALLIWALILE